MLCKFVGLAALVGAVICSPFDTWAAMVMGIASGAAFAIGHYGHRLVKPKRTLYIVDIKKGDIFKKPVWR